METVFFFTDVYILFGKKLWINVKKKVFWLKFTLFSTLTLKPILYKYMRCLQLKIPLLWRDLSAQQAHTEICISRAKVVGHMAHLDTKLKQTHQEDQVSSGKRARYHWPETCGPTTSKLWLNYWYSGVGRFASGGMKGRQHGNGPLILYGSLRAHSSQWRPNILTYVCRGTDCIWYQSGAKGENWTMWHI